MTSHKQYNSQETTPVGNDRCYENSNEYQPVEEEIIDFGSRAQNMLLLMGGIVLGVFSVFLGFALYYAMTSGNVIFIVLIGFFCNILASLWAAWLVTIFAVLFFFSVPVEKARVRATSRSISNDVVERTKNTVTIPLQSAVDSTKLGFSQLDRKIQQWKDSLLCKYDDWCPTELRNLRNEIVYGQDANDAGVVTIAVPLLLKRIGVLGDQTGQLRRTGTWHLSYENAQTEADLVYALVTELFISKDSTISLYASTLIHYFDWWLTLTGLRYLEAQKSHRNVNRLFLLPNGGIESIFEDYDSESQILKKAIKKEKEGKADRQSIFKTTYNMLSKEKSIIAIMLSHYIGANVWLLTPDLCRNPFKQVAQKLERIDTVALQQEIPSKTSEPLCFIEVTCTETTCEILRGVDAQICFSTTDCGTKIQQIKNLIKESEQWGLGLRKIIEQSPGLNNISEKIATTIRNRSLPYVQEELIAIFIEMSKEKNIKKGNNNG